MLEEMRERVEALWAEEGDDAGTEFLLEPGTRRLAGILECIEAVIGPDYKLSSLNARSTNPRNPEAQPWHVDAGAIADEAATGCAIRSGCSTTLRPTTARLG